MVKNLWLVGCILTTWTVVAVSSQAPAPAPAADVDCSSLIYNMADCLSFLSDGSNDTKPDDSCCSGFKSVLDIDADCICEGLKSSASLGLELNMTQAMALPSACGISAPSLSSCLVSLAPGAPPAACSC
ncbi:hypothetical protein F0562_013135 [Nyssa sinensis]|uniref:Bifunctional inhibitor/plant lipid transfer protein/seed storage helical domain-containing protein n=1 Tax=Nyssa sinensis TaxID=561372 RepID=A0A5J4ZX74_9ASTE|nr:hypothetical protein F0562_013135 [Nyssa sinensis]